ncbi:MAG: ribonucleoside triphosphate reductase [Candidatus Korarchaeota archaeon]|nr:ribonucleoside triphosphate reductase [Candidatus Korarchaeota archaeon]NIU84182.1 ribonucleoside triphosphate reductase [Candidatus Thorarchaeota archaeon]NIW14327.1 ribonucleoside triphosphate reductase [Candidatus Thorarchaeota archaeon]NIW52424.1 ribonucleoside triphosphate reductase [Candidatus Korarchaeota archaeon]
MSKDNREIRKRDGRIVNFQQEKITNAIWQAMQAVQVGSYREAKLLSEKVTWQLEEKFFKIASIPSVEDIQDIVEEVLIKSDYVQTARAYIRYRKEHEDIRSVRELFKNIEMVGQYLNRDTWEVKENSNQGFSLQGMNNYIKDQIVSSYWLTKIYPPSIQKAEESGDFHIHDLGTLGPYCVGWDLKDLLRVGFRGARGKLQSKPAKHFDTALMQVVNFLYTLQGEAAGAQAFDHFDVYLAPYIARDDLDHKNVKQSMQKFLFNMNVPTRTGFQAPFTNITLDLNVPTFMEDEPIVMRGAGNSVYGNYQREIDMLNRAFAEVMMEGDARDRPFSFPIPTINITPTFEWDREPLLPTWDMTAKYGIPYFANFINGDMKPEDSRSMCCRLRLDKSELKKRGGGLFGSYALTGSCGVVTINMPRIGYEASNEDEYFELLAERMDFAKKSLEIKRKTLERLTKKGLYPYSRFYLRDVKQRNGKYWSNHFSTIGLNGMNESLLNFMDTTIATDEGIRFSKKVLEFMRDKLKEYQEKTGDLWNLEATPAESTCYRLARKDKEKYPDIRIYNMEVHDAETPYYTNSTQLPVGHTDDLFRALKLQEPLQIKYTGGTVLHGFIGEQLPSGATARRLVRKVMHHSEIPYFTITPTFSVCPTHGYLSGEHQTCPKCNAQTEVYSRVVGYLRPVNRWNRGKQQEFEERNTFKTKVAQGLTSTTS